QPGGHWLVADKLWKDNAYGVCGTDDYLREHVDHGGGGGFFSGAGGRQAHPVLNPAGKDGWVRYRRPLSVNRSWRPIVTCLEDAEACARWNKSRKEMTDSGEAWGKSSTEIERALHITDTNGRVCLNLLLKAFRQECPDAARRIDQKRE